MTIFCIFLGGSSVMSLLKKMNDILKKMNEIEREETRRKEIGEKKVEEDI